MPVFSPEEGCVFASELTCILLFAIYYFLTKNVAVAQ